MDDIQNPSIEGSESFVVFLSSPQGAVLQEPYEANVVITDTFQDSMYLKILKNTKITRNLSTHSYICFIDITVTLIKSAPSP